MTGKEELMQYQSKVKRVDESLEEYQKFQDRATKVTAIISEAPERSNQTSDKVGDNATMMAFLNEEYKRRWEEAEKERLRIIDLINELDEPFRTIVHMRYIENLSFNEIVEKAENKEVNIPKSYDRIIHLHGIALKMFEKISK